MTPRMLALSMALGLFPAGTFGMHYPRKVHYDGAKDEEVLVQISGIGPSGTIPVNPGETPK
jgi:hypothetical protein